MTNPMTLATDDLPADCRAAAAVLNRDCFCNSVDRERLRQALASGVGGGISLAELLGGRPHLI